MEDKNKELEKLLEMEPGEMSVEDALKAFIITQSMWNDLTDRQIKGTAEMVKIIGAKVCELIDRVRDLEGKELTQRMNWRN